jgi:hypothetical protein
LRAAASTAASTVSVSELVAAAEAAATSCSSQSHEARNSWRAAPARCFRCGSRVRGLLACARAGWGGRGKQRKEVQATGQEARGVEAD